MSSLCINKKAPCAGASSIEPYMGCRLHAVADSVDIVFRIRSCEYGSIGRRVGARYAQCGAEAAGGAITIIELGVESDRARAADVAHADLGAIQAVVDVRGGDADESAEGILRKCLCASQCRIAADKTSSAQVLEEIT